MRSDALVLFGATGDLAYRQIFPALQDLVRNQGFDVPVVGVASTPLDLDALRARVRDSLVADGGVDPPAYARLASLLRYVPGDYRDPATFAALKRALAGAARPLFYMAIPPTMFAGVVGQLRAAGLTANARIMVEKPFGRDLASARALERELRSAFADDAIFRIDHFLGKEPVMNLFDETGCIRDVIQNHLLQVAACIALDAPERGSNHRAEATRLLRAIIPLSRDSIVRGQYRGYRDEPGVAPDSRVETFAAARFYIDSWRWAGVPFYLRAGKALATTATEVWVAMRPTPRSPFDEPVCEPCNYVRFRLGPDVTTAIGVRSKALGERMVGEPSELMPTVRRGARRRPCVRLLEDALDGDAMLFATWEAIEAQWQIVEPVLGDATPLYQYDRGTWGPPEVDRFIVPPIGWRNPQAPPPPPPEPAYAPPPVYAG